MMSNKRQHLTCLPKWEKMNQVVPWRAGDMKFIGRGAVALEKKKLRGSTVVRPVFRGVTWLW